MDRERVPSLDLFESYPFNQRFIRIIRFNPRFICIVRLMRGRFRESPTRRVTLSSARASDSLQSWPASYLGTGVREILFSASSGNSVRAYSFLIPLLQDCEGTCAN